MTSFQSFLGLQPADPPRQTEEFEGLDERHLKLLWAARDLDDPDAQELLKDLETKGLLRNRSLTDRGKQALREGVFRLESSPWDYQKDGKIWKSCAVVVSDGEDRELLLHWCGPAIDWHTDAVGASCEDLGLHPPEAGIWVWEGSMGSVMIQSIDYGVDWDHEVTGDFRPPTKEEWESIVDGECPWDKESLPKWEKQDD